MLIVRTSSLRALMLLSGLLVVLFTAVLMVGAPPAAAASSQSQERLDLARSVRAADSASVSALAADDEVSAQGSSSRCFSDVTGDTRNLDNENPTNEPRADIVDHCVEYDTHFSVSLQTSQSTDPLSDDNWRAGTFVGWFLNTGNDEFAEYFIEFSLSGNGTSLEARVSDVTKDPAEQVCTAEAQYLNRRYVVSGIEPSCLGNENRIRISPGMFYDAGGPEGDGAVHYDVAPNEGLFERAVQRQGTARCENPPPSDFADRSEISATHRPNVDCLFHLGIALGRDENGRRLFLPKTNVNRGQFAAFMFRVLQELDYQLPERSGERFSDVPADHVYDREIHQLAAADVLRGFDDGRYRPGATIRRDQIGSMAIQALEAVRGSNIRPQKPGEHFRDTDGNVHERNIDAAFEQNLISGIEAPTAQRQGRYVPGGQTNRERMASILVRFLNATS